MQKKDGVEVALDYYLQGVRCNPRGFPCVFNLACVYSQLDRHSNAKKWFNVAIKIQPLSIDSYYGSALSDFKQKRFQEAFNTLENMPQEAQSQNLKAEDLTYFKALCLKKLFKFKDAEAMYRSLQKQFLKAEGNKLIKYVFGIIVLPLQRERKVSLNFATSLRSLRTTPRTCMSLPSSTVRIRR